MRWEKLEIQSGGPAPGKRWGHTCNAVRGGQLLYIFGGYGEDNTQTNKVHVYDTSKFLYYLGFRFRSPVLLIDDLLLQFKLGFCYCEIDLVKKSYKLRNGPDRVRIFLVLLIYLFVC